MGSPDQNEKKEAEERAHLNNLAGNQSLGSYIRARLLGKDADKRRPVRRVGQDHQKLAQVLAELRRSRLASNMNQLAKSANMGTLDIADDVTADLDEACKAIAHMREMLIAALGLKTARACRPVKRRTESFGSQTRSTSGI